MKIAILIVGVMLTACTKNASEPKLSNALIQLQGSWISTSAECGAEVTGKLKLSSNQLKVEGSKGTISLISKSCQTDILFGLQSLGQATVAFRNASVVKNTCATTPKTFFGNLNFSVRKIGSNIELSPVSRHGLKCGVLVPQKS